MAATMQVLHALRRSSVFSLKPHIITGCYRSLLSNVYRCEDAWKSRLQSPVLSNYNFSEFIIKLYDKSELEGQISLLDISIVANKLHEIRYEEEELVVALLKRFRYSPDSFPTKDSVNHALIRTFMESNRTSQLLELMKNKIDYGIFPDSYAGCMLMDHFIKDKNYADASKVAYELMLQEDYSHELSRLLSLYSVVKHLSTDFSREYLQVEQPDEDDVQFIVVKVVKNPYYDDHFDIKDQRFLMGKTLYMLGRTVQEPIYSQSLQITGLALYDKYPKALDLLEKWINRDSQEPIISQEAMDMLTSCLDEAPTRDPDAPEKDAGQRTIDDEISLLKLTPAEKETCQERLQGLVSRLQSNSQISSDRLEDWVDENVVNQVRKHESDDVEKIKSLYNVWQCSWETLLQEQTTMYKKQEKEREIIEKLKTLQAQEELLAFYEERSQTKDFVKIPKQEKKKKEIVADTMEEFVDAPGERAQKKVKRK